MAFSTHEKNCIEFPFPHQESNMDCIYYLINDEGKLLYVGRTKNILQRIGTHWGNKLIPFTKCKYFFVKNEDASAIETEEILTHSPPHNLSIPPNERHFSYQRYKKINKVIKGRYIRVKKLIKELGIKDLNGFIHLEDWKTICSIISEEKKNVR